MLSNLSEPVSSVVQYQKHKKLENNGNNKKCLINSVISIETLSISEPFEITSDDLNDKYMKLFFDSGDIGKRIIEVILNVKPIDIKNNKMTYMLYKYYLNNSTGFKMYSFSQSGQNWYKLSEDDLIYYPFFIAPNDLVNIDELESRYESTITDARYNDYTVLSLGENENYKYYLILESNQ